MAKRISELPAGAQSFDTDEMEANQAGTSRRVTRAQLLATVAPISHTHPISDLSDGGTAAGLDAGTGIGDLVQLADIGGGTPGLPAVDGSQLTGVGGASQTPWTQDIDGGGFTLSDAGLQQIHEVIGGATITTRGGGTAGTWTRVDGGGIPVVDNTTVSLTKPAGMADRDILVLVLGGSQSGQTWTIPDGWQQHPETVPLASFDSNLVYKIIANAAGEPAQYDFVSDAGANEDPVLAWGLFRHDGTATPRLDKVVEGAYQSGTTPISPAAEAANNNSLVIRGICGDKGGTWTAPAGHSLSGQATPANAESTAALAWVFQATAGPAGTAQWTRSLDEESHAWTAIFETGSGGSEELDIDLSAGNLLEVTLDRDIAVVNPPTNAPASSSGFGWMLFIYQDATAGWNIPTGAWDAAFKFGDEGPPTLDTTSGKVNIISLLTRGTSTYFIGHMVRAA